MIIRFHLGIIAWPRMGNQTVKNRQTPQCFDPASDLFQSGQSTSQRQVTPFHRIRQFWRERVQEWYPHLFQQTYFLPSVFMNRTHHQEEEVYGQTVYVTKEPSSEPPRKRRRQVSTSEAVDDESHQRVLACLEQLAETEVMFVISQMQFGDYLNEPAYAAAASKLPKPGDPVLKSQNKHRGDFDVLIIHRHHGILACETKSVGSTLSSARFTEEEELKLAKKVKDAIKQMQKARDMLLHLVSKDETQPKIRTTLMLPNITRTQLDRVLNLTNNQQLLKVDSSLSTCSRVVKFIIAIVCVCVAGGGGGVVSEN